VLFFLPWQGNTIAGTTESQSKIVQNPHPSESDIQWILSQISAYLSPDIQVRRTDVLGAWSGIRPLVRDPKSKDSKSLVRNHLIDISRSGLITCAGGKWTTYRQMAEETVDAAIKQFNLKTGPLREAPSVSGTQNLLDNAKLDGRCQTHQLKLIGAHGFTKLLFISLIQHFGMETTVARHLAHSYGDRSWSVAQLCGSSHERFPLRGVKISNLYPYVDGEIRYAVREEYAETAIDVLARRTRLAFLNAQAALEALPMVIDIMGQELNWDDSRREREMKDATRFLGAMGLPESNIFMSGEKSRDEQTLTKESSTEPIIADKRVQGSRA
jgi:glycerol-3-phosphate dehydrogenase